MHTIDSSTLTPAQVASAMVAHGVAKHRTRLDRVLFKAVLAGVFLSFGGLLSEVVSGGAPGLTASNPGLVKVLGGFVFPVGLVMCVAACAWRAGADARAGTGSCYRASSSSRAT
jgi:formate/nitrite transporter FocA (FNT family)